MVRERDVDYRVVQFVVMGRDGEYRVVDLRSVVIVWFEMNF